MRFRTFQQFFSQKISSLLALLFFLSAGFILGQNLWNLKPSLDRFWATRNHMIFRFPGIRLSGFQPLLKGQTHVSYISDKDLDDLTAAAEFGQGQYLLAPVILDETGDHDLILINMSSSQKAQDVLKKLNAVPLAANRFGVILARRLPPPPAGNKTP